MSSCGGSHYRIKRNIDLLTFAAVFAVLCLLLPQTVYGVDFSIATNSYHDSKPVVVYNTANTEYLVVWEYAYSGTDHHIYAQRVDSNGTLLGGRWSVATTSGWENTPAVAYNASSNEYLIAYEIRVGADEFYQTDILVKRFSATGSVLAGPYTAADTAKSDSNPRVAHNSVSNEYLVVWEHAYSATDRDVYGQRVSGAGALLGSDIVINGTSYEELAPDVSYTSWYNDYLVVWQDKASGSYDIHARRIEYNGTIIDTTDIVVASWEYDLERPRVDFNSTNNQFLVVWEDHRWSWGAAWDIYGQRIWGSGAAMLGENFAISWDGDNHREHPEVAYNPELNNFQVVWEYEYSVADHDVYCQLVGSDGSLLDSEYPVSNSGYWEETPVVARGAGDNYLVVWSDDRNTSGYTGLYGELTPVAVVPYVYTDTAQSITATSATLRGWVNPWGRATTYYFQYGTTTGYGSSTTTQEAGSGEIAFQVSSSVSGLLPGTLYHFRIVATNAIGTTYGADRTFTTPPNPPTVYTYAASSVGPTTATLNGALNPNGGVTDYHFDYGLTTGYGSSTGTQSTGAGHLYIYPSAGISGLLPNRTYYFRLAASNSAGTRYGSQQSFTTQAMAPSVTTLSASGSTATSITFNGTVNPNGSTTSYYFQYGPDQENLIAFGFYNVGDGHSTLSRALTVASLPPNYSGVFRMVANNAAGTRYGSFQPFATLAIPPGVTTDPVSGLTPTTVTLNGKVNPNGSSTTCYFRYGETTSYGTSTAAVPLGAGRSQVTVSAPLTGLSPATRYHYQLVAYNSEGMVATSGDQQFQTPADPPVVTTEAADQITPSSARFRGVIDPKGTSTSYYFQYGPTISYGSVTAADLLLPIFGGQNISASVSNLLPNTTCHFRLVATNSGGTAYSADRFFNTPAAPPAVTTQAATSVSGRTATLNGSVNPNGSSTAWAFEYGLTTDYGFTTELTDAGAGTSNVTVSAGISGLSPETTYHYRIFAANGVGTADGSDLTFTTGQVLPIAVTGPAEGITSTSAVLTGDVDLYEPNTAYYFEYGPTTSFGFQTTQSLDPILSATISGLTPDTLYYYRMVAVNNTGAGYGAIHTFATLMPSITWGGEFPIVTNSASQETPDLAWSVQAGVLAVWVQETTLGNRDIYGRLLAADGSQLSSPFIVAANPNDDINPVVIYDTWLERYLLVWEYAVSADNHDIYAQWLSNDGSPYGSRLTVANGAAFESNPKITEKRGEKLIVWEHLSGADEFVHNDIYARRLDSNGALYSGESAGIQVAAGGLDESAPTVATEGYDFLVVWQAKQAGSGEYDIHGQVIDENGLLEGSAIVISSWEYDQVAPKVVFSDYIGYVVVWEDHHWGWGADWDIYGQRLQGDGTLIGSNFGIAWEGAQHRLNPDIACFDTLMDCMVVWEYEYSPSDYDVYGRKLIFEASWEPDPEITYEPEVFLSRTGANELQPVVGKAYVSYVTAWADGRSFSSNGLDIYGKAFPLPAPTASTGQATNITGTAADLNGVYNPNGLTSTFFFEWGPTVNYSWRTHNQGGSSGHEDEQVSNTVDNLIPNSWYHFRIGAENDAGTGIDYGADQIFKTAATAPEGVTEMAAGVTGTSAKLRGSLNPYGLPGSYYFEYGPTTTYGGQTASVNFDPGFDSAYVDAAITGLTPETTYHYRLVVTNAQGAHTGDDHIFYTSQDVYTFERMWPTLQQPWYFSGANEVAVGPYGYIYIVDTDSHRIQKFNSDGKLISTWGHEGSNSGEFKWPKSMAFDAQGNIYVADTGNYRIQKFSPDGTFITKWGSEGGISDMEFDLLEKVLVGPDGYLYVSDFGNGRIAIFSLDGNFISNLTMPWTSRDFTIDSSGYIYIANRYSISKYHPDGTLIVEWGRQGTRHGEFDTPSGIAVDNDGSVYVSELFNHRVQKFNVDGRYVEFIASWGGEGTANGEFKWPRGITIGPDGLLYVVESSRIQKFDAEGSFVGKWGSSGFISGYFDAPESIATGNGSVYVLDTGNHRVQRFSPNGSYELQWGGYGTGNNEFKYPRDLAIDSTGNVYVVDTSSSVVKKFDANGNYIATLQGYGSAFYYPNGIAIDSADNVYIADTNNSRVQKFDAGGNFLAEWNGSAQGGAFDHPYDIAVDQTGNIYVADTWNDQVQVFTFVGNTPQYVTHWGQSGEHLGELDSIKNLTVDDAGDLYVIDSGKDIIQKFSPDGNFLGALGQSGSAPGQFRQPGALAISSAGKYYVVETKNNRVQVFNPVTLTDNNKAIIIAGGGIDGNNLWNATQMSANFAYWTLINQGFVKDNIHYLSPESNVDLDANGLKDDIDADATNANLQDAITSWASDADSLVIYLVDHGGNDLFKTNATEILTSTDLASWLDNLQNQSGFDGLVTVIYDACEAGSMMNDLAPPSGKQRIVITSTSPGEAANFVTQGSISFSAYFWAHVFSGENVLSAFNQATSALANTTAFQNPLLDDNGNGVANEAGDGSLAAVTYIGNGTQLTGNAPVISGAGATPTGNSTALIQVDSVTDPGGHGLARVWAIIRPPNYTQGSANNPVGELPTIDLHYNDSTNKYEATYAGLNFEGTYKIALYARDAAGNTSIPVLTEVVEGNPLRRRAVIIAASTHADPENDDPLWPAVEQGAELAYAALTFQGYTDSDIEFFSPIAFSTGWDGDTSLSNVAGALSPAVHTDTQDLVLFMIGQGAFEELLLNSSQTLEATALEGMLTSLQDTIPGKVTVVYDASYSGSFLQALTASPGYERILVTSTSEIESANLVSGGDVSFSKFFWSRVLNGINVRDAFWYAENAINYAAPGQSPQLDDDGDGVGNETTDGLVARYYTIGMGIQLLGNDPLGGDVSSDIVLAGSTSADIEINNVTSTGSVASVWAVITPPPTQQVQFDESQADTDSITLAPLGNDSYRATYNDFSLFGDYYIAVYIKDTDGNMSTPKSMIVTQTAAPDVYEDDDSPANARVIVVDKSYQGAQLPGQKHNFYPANDEDWVKFYGIYQDTYDIAAMNRGSNCDTLITIENSSGTELKSSNNFMTWRCPADGIYYVKVTHTTPGTYGVDTEYELGLYHPIAGTPGDLVGKVTNTSGQGIDGATVKTTTGNYTALAYPTGDYIITLPSGTYSITASAGPNYLSQTVGPVVVQANNYTHKDISLSSANQPPVVSDIPDQSVAEGAPFATILLDNYVDDPDNGDSQITWSASPASHLDVDIANRVATITPLDSNWSGSETITFTATDPGLKSDSDAALFTVVAVPDGDVNNDGGVDLADLILTLKVMGSTDAAGVAKAADVDGDGQIGLPEAIFILQKMAGLRN